MKIEPPPPSELIHFARADFRGLRHKLNSRQARSYCAVNFQCLQITSFLVQAAAQAASRQTARFSSLVKYEISNFTLRASQRHSIERLRYGLLLIPLFYRSIVIWANQRPEQLNDLTTCTELGSRIQVSGSILPDLSLFRPVMEISYITNSMQFYCVFLLWKVFFPFGLICA